MRFLLGVLMLMISGSALATIDVLQFKDEAQEQQFRQLTEELRCPKCQNNSIADSNSMIATDLRQKVYELMQEGKSKKEIVDYMVARYGNFVTYDPPLTPLTVLLWVLPVVAIGIGGWVIYARSRRRVRVVPEAFPEQSVQEGKRAGYIVYLPGIVVELDYPVDISEVSRVMENLLLESADKLLRYKGMLWIDGEPNRLLFQGVQRLYSADWDRPWGDEKPHSTMVFIGIQLPEEEIRAAFAGLRK